MRITDLDCRQFFHFKQPRIALMTHTYFLLFSYIGTHPLWLFLSLSLSLTHTQIHTHTKIHSLVLLSFKAVVRFVSWLPRLVVFQNTVWPKYDLHCLTKNWNFWSPLEAEATLWNNRFRGQTGKVWLGYW